LKQIVLDQAVNYFHDLRSALTKTALENPSQLAQYRSGDEEMFAIAVTVGEKKLDDGSLSGIVVGHEADQDVGVDGPHSPRAPRAIASSISFRVIGRPSGDLIIPRMEWKSVLIAFSEKRPVRSFTKSTRSPGFSPISSRTSLGMVTWPFDVTVLFGMVSLLQV
jgi:hypothetical protein